MNDPAMTMSSRTTTLAALAGLLAVGGFAASAAAQGPGGGTTPFSGITRRPSISPYMGLAFQGNNPTTGGTLGAMQGLVRPQQQQLSQQQQQARQMRQLSQLQGQVRRIQRPQMGSTIDTIRATGHAATYLELSHFYPAAR